MRVLHDTGTGSVSFWIADRPASGSAVRSAATESHNEWTESRGLVIPDNQDVFLRSRVMEALRAFGADPVGIDEDATIGATALAYHMALITDDRALENAVTKLGGEVRRFR